MTIYLIHAKNHERKQENISFKTNDLDEMLISVVRLYGIGYRDVKVITSGVQKKSVGNKMH